MKDFFKVKHLEDVFGYKSQFNPVGTETISLTESFGRILAEDLVADCDLPDFPRSIMDGYAVCASSTFGATEGNPAYLEVKGAVLMGEKPDFSLKPGEAAKIPTGGMIPDGADSVVMIEYTEAVDNTNIEVYRSVAPGQHIIEKGEDFKKNEIILGAGQKIRPQEAGLLAAFGMAKVEVFKKPVIGIISTGDEVVGINETPKLAQIRDINSYSLSGLVQKAGGIPVAYGIVPDNFDDLFKTCSLALKESDMVLISGGSSVGTRDLTIEVLSDLPNAEVLAHGISISPGKPTILTRVGEMPFWGLPGHVVSSMIVFKAVVSPFVEHMSGISDDRESTPQISAFISRNISSAQGRTDFIRVRLTEKEGELWAEPILGKSALINTMVKAQGIIKIGLNTEGIEKGTKVQVIPV